ncbi:cyclase family protein [Pseudonocardia xinjiangensis]|uniref:Cyclase family protein n=2 Tax=Pseudonocardia xinjiangensis TaxID=75289 RepID=A0ABX1R6Z6_9PSEU|nr:cyclase family protein [Pseudonocardia xinjiangensis]
MRSVVDAMGGETRVVDLSHVVVAGMTTYPGLPGPEITDHLSRADSRGRYAPGTEFQIGRISMVANTGTYLDTPFHRFGDGADLAGVPLSGLVDLDGVVIRAERRAVGAADLSPYRALIPGRAVLVHTGWDRHWGTVEYADPGHPYLTAEATELLAALRPAVVGIDSVNIDDMADLSRPAHTGLLAAAIPIIEHMTGLDRLPDRDFRFHGAPIAVAGMGTFPIRAYALVGRRE